MPKCCVTSGCHYVILGHSERRTILGETDAEVSQKLGSGSWGELDPDRLRR